MPKKNPRRKSHESRWKRRYLGPASEKKLGQGMEVPATAHFMLQHRKTIRDPEQSSKPTNRQNSGD
jgi:hypothetical protein